VAGTNVAAARAAGVPLAAQLSLPRRVAVAVAEEDQVAAPQLASVSGLASYLAATLGTLEVASEREYAAE
jgi:hypothetical protein